MWLPLWCNSWRSNAAGGDEVALPLGLYAQLACIWEATAAKPGNVHRYHDFADVTYLDFIQSAAAIAPVLTKARRQPIGQTILEGVRATRRVVATNTNLGILLLLAPLAAVHEDLDLRAGLEPVLAGLDVEDSRAVYTAIRLAEPSDLGRVSEQDIGVEPTLPLRQIMALAAERDLIARQYANNFHEVFTSGVPALVLGLSETASVEAAIIACHLHFLATHPDSLIARKCGQAAAMESSRRARRVLESGWPTTAAGREALVDLDAWLRAEGNSRNPGTTADLVTACLFVALREGRIALPLQYPWTAGSSHA
jgi:triphosphoribosyl-dephospho-CoA synthase